MIHIDHYAYLSKIKNVNPFQKMMFSLVTLATCILLNNVWVSLWVILAMAGYTVLKGGIPLAFFVRLMLLPISFLLIGLLTIAVNFQAEATGLLWAAPVGSQWVGISQSGLHLASGIFMKALGATACLYALSLNTPMVALLSAFRRMGLPVLLADLMGLIYRFIFVLLDTSASIMTAQHARLGYGSIRTGYHSFGAMLTMLLIRALKRSDDLYTALEARGYQGDLTVLEEAYTDSPGLVWGTVVLNGFLGVLWFLSR